MVFDRRGFMMFMAGASAGIMATPLPWKLLDDVSIWTQNWGWIPSLKPGESTFVPATSKMCPSSVATTVRLVDGRPVRVLPRADHPLGGGVSAIAAAEVQMLQSPSRVQRPLRRSPDGVLVQIEWSEAMELLSNKITEAKGKTAFISGDENGSTTKVISAFANTIGSKDVYLMPSEGQAAAKAARLAGIDGTFGYDLENSDFVLAVGANILENWGPVIRNRRIFRDSRPHPVEGATDSMTLIYAGAMQNHTAAVASEWMPIKPGTEGILLLFLANQLIAKGAYAFAEDFAAFKSLAGKFTVEETATRTGLSKEKLLELAKALGTAKTPLVIAGTEAGAGGGATNVLLSFAVNSLLDNINKTGGMTLLPEAPSAIDYAAKRTELFQKDLASWLLGGTLPELLVVHDANPAYALPDQEKVRERLGKIPFKVCFSTFLDETAAMCDLVFPMPMGLERSDDIDTPYGVGHSIYCVTDQAVQPVVRTMNTADALLFIHEQLRAAGKVQQNIGLANYQKVLESQAAARNGNLKTLKSGEALESKEKLYLSTHYLRPDVVAKNVLPKQAEGGLALNMYSKLNLGTATTGIPPFNVKTVRSTELDGKYMFVTINPASANGLSTGDVVNIAANGKSISAKVHLSEQVMPGVVAIATGFGHTAFDQFSQNKGSNVMDILSSSAESGTELSVWSQTAVVVTKA